MTDIPRTGDEATSGPQVAGEVGFPHAAAKVRKFPQGAGVYLMKDAAGRVIYIGKAKNLRSRAGSYFQKGAEAEWRTAPWIHENL